MIVRPYHGLELEETRWLTIHQYAHSQLAGQLARLWRGDLNPRERAIKAISLHDFAWEPLDAQCLRDDEGRPVDFTRYPEAPRLAAYSRGLDELEQEGPYVACLCSMHYASFFTESPPGSQAAAFRQAEEARQARLKRRFQAAWLDELPFHFRLLKLCDTMSLFLCMNRPGRLDVAWTARGDTLPVHAAWLPQEQLDTSSLPQGQVIFRPANFNTVTTVHVLLQWRDQHDVTGRGVQHFLLC